MRAFTSGPRLPAAGPLLACLPGDIRIVVGDRRADRQPARPGGRPVRDRRRRLPAHRRGRADRRATSPRPAGPGRPGRAAWTRITVIGLLAAIYQSCYFTAVSLTSVPLATLVTIGAAPVIVLGADRVTGRPAGRLAVAHHRPGRDRPRAARGPAVRVPRDRGPGQRGHGRARRGGLRRDHPDRLPAGARPGRPHRDRVRLHHRRPAPDAAGAASRGHRASGPGSRPSACWSRWAPARPPWPTRCTSAACGPPPRARPPG